MGIRASIARTKAGTARSGILLALALVLSGCGATYTNHGYVPPQEDLDQIAVGIDTRSTVVETLGASGATSVLEDNALYFVRSRVRTFMMLEPEVVERSVVAVSFDGNGVVPNIPAFYEAFKIQPGDKLYLDPAKRVKIW